MSIWGTLLGGMIGFSFGGPFGALLGSQWCFHTHHTYDSHPFKTITESSIYKGLGIELRLIGCDPDQAEIRAKEKGFKILSNSHDKAHGMRECYILDNDNYCWVPSIII
jgi:hypothetical protein